MGSENSVMNTPHLNSLEGRIESACFLIVAGENARGELTPLFLKQWGKDPIIRENTQSRVSERRKGAVRRDSSLG